MPWAHGRDISAVGVVALSVPRNRLLVEGYILCVSGKLLGYRLLARFVWRPAYEACMVFVIPGNWAGDNVDFSFAHIRDSDISPTI